MQACKREAPPAKTVDLSEISAEIQKGSLCQQCEDLLQRSILWTGTSFIIEMFSRFWTGNLCQLLRSLLRSARVNVMPERLLSVISGILAGGIPGFRIELCCYLHPLTWPLVFFCVLFVLLLVRGHSHNDTQDVIMHESAHVRLAMDKPSLATRYGRPQSSQHCSSRPESPISHCWWRSRFLWRKEIVHVVMSDH